MQTYTIMLHNHAHTIVSLSPNILSTLHIQCQLSYRCCIANSKENAGQITQVEVPSTSIAAMDLGHRRPLRPLTSPLTSIEISECDTMEVNGRSQWYQRNIQCLWTVNGSQWKSTGRAILIHGIMLYNVFI